MENKYVKWQNKRRTRLQRFLFIIPLATFFIIILPLILIVLSYYLDAWLNLQRFISEPLNFIVGILLIVPGFVYAIWTVKVQFGIGKGTPLPTMPTQKLIIISPYTYCRNPMAFGTIIFYSGIAVFMSSLSALGLLVLMTSVLLIYIKLVEEKELKIRFGKEYVDYKKRVPFLIPNFRL